LIFTEEILRQVIAFATWKTAKSLGIVTDEDPALPDGVVELISASTGHKGALEEFVAAYEAWYKFHLEIYKDGKSGRLSPSEYQELNDLIARRDRARKNLIAIT
jgi:hypothetical protein